MPHTISIKRSAASATCEVTINSTTVGMHLNGGHFLITKVPVKCEDRLINVAIVDNAALIIPEDFFKNPNDSDWMLDDDFPITSVTMNGAPYPFRFNY